jgi:hypothetical protein
MKTGTLLEFRARRPEPKQPEDVAYAERLVELSIALNNGEISIQDLQEEVEGWR